MIESYSLSGVWRFCTDPDNIGIDQQWMLQENQPYLENKTRTFVPSCWNRDTWTQFASYAGVAWMWRRFSVPVHFLKKKVVLNFVGIVHSIQIFIDGKEIGQFQGAFIPFSIPLPEEYKDGKSHFMALRIDGSPEKNIFKGLQPTKNYTGFTGPIELQTIEKMILEEFSVGIKLPKAKFAELEFQIYLHNVDDTDFRGNIIIELSKDFVPMFSITREVQVLKQNSRMSKIVLQCDNPELWTLENPVLYNLKMSVASLQTPDTPIVELAEVIGIRQTEISEKAIVLNGQPVPLVIQEFDLGHSHFGFCLPDVLIFDRMSKMKAEGVNLIRPKFGVFNHTVIETASRLGILVINDLPLIKTREEFFRNLVEGIKYLPALVAYSIHPSTNLTDPESNRTYTELQRLFTTRLDPYRNVIPGWFNPNK